MIDRLEVTPGPGTVIRYGYVAAWVSASASPNLVSFLAESARNLAGSAVGGDQVADHLAGVLARRDPEPHVPFVVVGPSEDGWAALLHGPVQVWDGARWTAPSPHPGWIRVALAPSPALSASVSGAAVPPLSPDSMWDLEAGVVPGGGFILVPAVPSVGRPLPLVTAPDDEAVDPTAAVNQPVDQTAVMSRPDPSPATEVLPVRPEPARPEEAEEPPGLLDLRRPEVLARAVAYPPLPPAGDPARPLAGVPVVAGVPCPRGHLNRPGMPVCARCGLGVAPDAFQVSGTRPALGCLITDSGVVYRLDSGYLVGSEPARDPTVRGRLARPLTLPGDDVAPGHAEIRLQDWDVVLTDRASPAGTHVYEPGGPGWERLRPYEPRALPPGTHIALGQRVLTFVTPWTLAVRTPGSDTEGSTGRPRP